MAQSILRFLLISGFVHGVLAERICDSIQIGPNNASDLSKLAKCDVIVGSLKIVKIYIENKTEILSPLKEITGFLLIYRVEGISSLGEILPNLVVIRGNELLFDKYSFVVMENIFLKNLGLYSLKAVQNGNIRIENNPSLCYLKTIHWSNIITDHKTQAYNSIKNKNENFCPMCKEDSFLDPNHQNLCWDYDHFQEIRDSDDKCLKKEISKNKTICSVCVHFKDSKGFCRDTCAPIVINHIVNPGKRECLTKEECESRPGYFLDGLTCERGKKDTKNYCSGKIYLSTAEKIRELKYCSVINGSITIEIEDIRSNLIPELEENLMGITTIQGYLEVKNTPQITSLHFFKNLDTIVGNELLQGDIALYVVNNHYLEDIWYPNRKIQIQNGRLHFHLNPRLCYHKIKALQPQLKSGENITIADVAPHSNGQETLCQEELELFVEIENYNSTAARIKLSPLIKERKTVHLGYLFYYREIDREITMFEGRHGCMMDDWIIEKNLDKNLRYVIKDLKPNTPYALFAKTFSVTGYHVEANSVSKMKYFKTLPGRPTAVQEFYYNIKNTSAVELHWWPPKNLNGFIDRYEIFWNEVNTEIPDDDELFNGNLTCDAEVDCLLKTRKQRLDLNDDNHFHREVLLLDDVVPNILFSKNTNIKSDSVAEKKPDKVEKVQKVTKKSVTKKPTNQEQKTEKTTTIKSILEYIDSIPEEELGFEGMEIIDGFKDDFAPKSPLTTHVKQVFQKSPNSILEEKRPDKVPQTISSQFDRISSIQVPGNVHSYLLGGLESEEHYKVSIMACVKTHSDSEGLCGPVITMYVTPENLSVAQFFKKYNISLV